MSYVFDHRSLVIKRFSLSFIVIMSFIIGDLCLLSPLHQFLVLLLVITMRYTVADRAKAVQLFIECKKNFKLFASTWTQRTNEAAPSKKTMLRLLKRFETTGILNDLARSGRKRLRDDDLVVSVGAYFTAETNRSLNDFLEENGNVVSRTTLWRILRKDLMWRPYRPRRVHRLIPGDTQQRYWCFHYFLERLNTEPTFLTSIIWSDECLMKLDGTIITNNVVQWASENPHISYQKSTNRSGVMVFAAISVVGVVAIGFFDEMTANINRSKKNSVNKESYTEMLREKLLPGILNFYPDTEFQHIYFMQDGAPSHRIPDFLNATFKNKWIGNSNHGAPITWPSRSPDMTPMGKKTFILFIIYYNCFTFIDFSFWGHLRQKVYMRSPTDISELKRFITEEAEALPLSYFWNTCNSHVLRRWIECKRSSGQTIENTYDFN